MTRRLVVDEDAAEGAGEGEAEVHVVAVEALRRQPGYWRARLR
jgi:hypothetical protein